MALQSCVEKCHHGKRSNIDALWFTMKQAWESFDPQIIENVWLRWQKVLWIIIAVNGGNATVDKSREKFYKERASSHSSSLSGMDCRWTLGITCLVGTMKMVL